METVVLEEKSFAVIDSTFAETAKEEVQIEKTVEENQDSKEEPDQKHLIDEISEVKEDVNIIKTQEERAQLQHEKHDQEDDTIKPLIDEDVYKQGEIQQQQQQQQDTASQDSGFDSRITIKENGVECELNDESSQPDKEYLDKEVKKFCSSIL